MKLIKLKCSEARHVMLWLSPKGEIYSLLLTENEVMSPLIMQLIASRRLSMTLLVKSADMICRRESIISESPFDYLLNHGWVYYCQCGGNWVWYAKEINSLQVAIARQIDDNRSLHLLIEKWAGKSIGVTFL